MAEKGRAKLSSLVFLVGIVLAIIFGLIYGANYAGKIHLTSNQCAYLAMILGLIGLIAGILGILGMGTITKGEIPTFLIATVIIVAISGANVFTDIKWFGYYLYGIVTALGIFIAPLAGLLAIKAIWDIGKD